MNSTDRERFTKDVKVALSLDPRLPQFETACSHVALALIDNLVIPELITQYAAATQHNSWDFIAGSAADLEWRAFRNGVIDACIRSLEYHHRSRAETDALVRNSVKLIHAKQ